MKKRVLILFCILTSIFLISFVSAFSGTYYPVSGIDYTDSHSHTLTSSDLAKVNTSDDNKYQSHDDWHQINWGNEYIQWNFAPSLGLEYYANQVTLTFEWQRGSWLSEHARILVCNKASCGSFSSGDWVEYPLFAPSSYSDVSETINLGQMSAEQINNLKVVFQSYFDDNDDTYHDLVRLNVIYTQDGQPPEVLDKDNDGYNYSSDCNDYIREINPGANEVCNGLDDDCDGTVDEGCTQVRDTVAPVCSVDKLGSYVLSSSTNYINTEGYYTTYGSAYDADSGFVTSSYPASVNRTSPGAFWTWVVADDVSQNPDWNNIIWNNDFPTSSGRNDYYFNGNHRICCKAVDSAGNVFTGGCKDICVDSVAPSTISSPSANGQDCSDENILYSNTESISWSWTAPNSNGCSPLLYYEIQLYYSDGELISTTTQESTTFSYTGVNGEDYYIKVRARDAAGNIGTWSENSQEIVVDTTNPSVTIDAVYPQVNDGEINWITSGFYVNETDSDTNLLSCKISVNGAEWIVPCNSPVYVDNNNCTTDGIATCTITKTATDKACNSNSDSERLNVDKQNPSVEKIVGQPKVSPWGSWIETLINGFFIKDTTPISLSCYDSASGVDTIYYQVDEGNWVEYSDPFYITTDGVHRIDYYCTDKVGHSSSILYEIDKVDNIAPETTKIIGQPSYQNGYYVTSSTPIVLTGSDSEVGCANTYYNYDDNGDGYDISSTEGCNRTVNWGDSEDGEYMLYFWSVDKLGNTEQTKNQTHYLDNTPPRIIIHNPTYLEAQNVTRCDQSVVVEIIETGSGLNEQSVYAKLVNSSGSVVRNIILTKARYTGINGGVIFEGLMDKQLPAGDYTLEIYASDNLGNEGSNSISEILKSGITIEYLNPSSCSVPNSGGSCVLSFHACVRNSDSMKFWLDKIDHIITPDMMNASVSNNLGNAFVGLKDATDAGILPLSSSPMNGKTVFNLSLYLNSNLTSIIGPGAYDLDYYIESGLI